MDTGTLAAKPDSVIKPQKLSHGTCMVGDLKRSRKFYREFLGLDVVRHGERSMMFRLNTGMHVVAVELGPDKLWDMHVMHHWGVDVESREAVDAAYEAAKAQQEKWGIKKVQKPVMQHGVYSFYIQDLDNNWWEIQHAHEQHERCFARGDIVNMDD